MDVTPVSFSITLGSGMLHISSIAAFRLSLDGFDDKSLLKRLMAQSIAVSEFV